jgi:hypothetical protein
VFQPLLVKTAKKQDSLAKTLSSALFLRQYGHPPRAEQSHSWAAGDLRQSQLAALALPNIGLSTAIDTGDWTNIHPPDKQTPSQRLADQALVAIYKKDIPGSDFPLFVSQAVTANTVTQTTGGTVSVTVKIEAGGAPCTLSTAAPLAATQSTTLGKGVSVPRNQVRISDCAQSNLHTNLKSGPSASPQALQTPFPRTADTRRSTAPMPRAPC